MPSEVAFREVRKMLEGAGYELARIRGSHHIFSKEDAALIVIAVHRGKVKYGYVRSIQQIIAGGKAAQEDDHGKQKRKGDGKK